MIDRDRNIHPGPPMTLGNMRALLEQCHASAVEGERGAGLIVKVVQRARTTSSSGTTFHDRRAPAIRLCQHFTSYRLQQDNLAALHCPVDDGST